MKDRREFGNDRKIKKGWENSMMFSLKRKPKQMFRMPVTRILPQCPPSHYLAPVASPAKLKNILTVACYSLSLPPPIETEFLYFKGSEVILG